MNINNLYEGRRFKNYVELCEVLDVKKQSGKAKILQLNKLRRYCDFTKENRQYIITQIYDTPKQKKDGRLLSRKRKFLPYLEVLIKLSWIPEQEYVTYKSLIKRCGLYNKYYAEYILNKQKFCQQYDIKNDYAEDFFYEYEKKLIEIFKTAMTNLSNRNEVIAKPVIMVKKYYGIVEGSEEEQNRIEELENILLDEKGINSKYARYYRQYNDINKKVLADEELRGIKYYYRALKIEQMNELNIEDIQDIFGKDYAYSLCNHEETVKLKDISNICININLANFLNDRFLRLHESSLNQNKKWSNFRKESSYLETQKKLIDVVFNNTTLEMCNNIINSSILEGQNNLLNTYEKLDNIENNLSKIYEKLDNIESNLLK